MAAVSPKIGAGSGGAAAAQAAVGVVGGADDAFTDCAMAAAEGRTATVAATRAAAQTS